MTTVHYLYTAGSTSCLLGLPDCACPPMPILTCRGYKRVTVVWEVLDEDNVVLEKTEQRVLISMPGSGSWPDWMLDWEWLP